MRSFKPALFVVCFGLLLLVMSACTHRAPKPLNERMMLDLHTNLYHVIPDECFDDNGEFDEDLGHDTLDCGNLQVYALSISNSVDVT